MVSSRKCKTVLFASCGAAVLVICYLTLLSPDGYNWSVLRKSIDDEANFVISDSRKIPLISHSERTGGSEFMARVVYNRVGKCGSRTMQNIIRVLAKTNSYNFYLSAVSNETRPKMLSLINEVHLIDSIAPPMLYSRHIHFINFPKFGVNKPLYINVIRDPIQRFSSQYHFKRFGDMIQSKGRKTDFKRGEKDLDINECILSNHTECMPAKLWYLIPYFCGQAAFCRLPSMEALRRAKMNVLDNYLAVGVLEDLTGTLQVFEKLLPIHFGGALEVYEKQTSELGLKNTSTVGKKALSTDAYDLLKKRMELDYEFYDFVLNVFKNLKKKLNILN